MNTVNTVFAASQLAGFADLAARHGTPLWVYDAPTIRRQIAALKSFDTIRYAQKANSNTHILRLMRAQGVKVDAVSLGEIERALAAGYEARRDSASDIVFTAEQFIQLIENTDHKSVCCGMYLMDDQRHLAIVKDWDKVYFKAHGSFKFLTPEDIQNIQGTHEKFMPISYGGMGFFAVRKEVLNLLKYPYFYRKLERIEMDDGTTLRDMSSEDVCFCKNLQKAGVTVYLDTTLRVGHEKRIVI